MAKKLNGNEKVKLSNQSLVFEVFGDDEKLTISEVMVRINSKAAEDPTLRLSDQTVRKAIRSLMSSGLLRQYGKTHNAMTYGKLSANFADPESQRLVPFAGEMTNVEEFLRLMTDVETRPLKLKTNLLAEKSQHNIRRLMVFAILSAGEPGNSDRLKQVNEQLHNAIGEFEWLANSLRSFVDSPVWYEQYRDRIALAVRETQKKDPELIQLAIDYMRS